jgi:hypothetical protein
MCLELIYNMNNVFVQSKVFLLPMLTEEVKSTNVVYTMDVQFKRRGNYEKYYS